VLLADAAVIFIKGHIQNPDRRNFLPSIGTTWPLVTPSTACIPSRKHGWNCSGWMRIKTRSTVSWLGMPCPTLKTVQTSPVSCAQTIYL